MSKETEANRLEALANYDIMDSIPEDDFEDIVKLASSICEVPISLVSFVDDKRQWFKAKLGLEVAQTPKDVAFCAHAIERPNELFIVYNADEDKRFKDNELVTSFPNIKFYAGSPIVSEDGYAMGTVCVIDTKPRELTEVQKTALKALSNQVSKLLELRKSKVKLEKEKNLFERFAELSPNIIYRYDSTGKTSYHNSRVKEILGYAPEEFRKDPDLWTTLIHPQDVAHVKKVYASATDGAPIDITYRMLSKSNSWRWIKDRSTSLTTQDSRKIVEGVAEDVTEIIQTRNELEDVFAKYKLATSESGEGIWEWDLKTNACFFSENWAHLLGFSEELSLTHIDDFRNILHPDDVDLHDKEVREIIRQKSKLASLEFRIRKSDHSYGWFLAKGSVVVDEDGQPIKLIGATSEITSKKEIEQELVKTKELLEEAGKMSKVGAWEVSMITGEVYWSKVTRDIHEVSHDLAVSGLDGIQFYKKGFFRNKITQCVEGLLKEGIEYDEELKIITAKGNEKWVRAIGKREFINGETIRIYGTFQDIDGQKKAQSELVKTKTKLESILNEVESVIWSVSLPDYKMIFSTPSVVQLYEYSMEEWEENSRLWIELIHPEDKHFEQKIWDKLARKNEYDLEYRIITKSGTIKWIKNKGKTIYDENGVPVRVDGITTEITKRKYAEAELNELIEITKSQNERLKNYAYIVSHNLRSHTSNILSLFKFINDEMQNEVKNNEAFVLLGEASSALMETITHLSNIVFEDTLKRKETENIDLVSFIQKGIKNLAKQSKNQHVDLLFDKTDPVFVKGIKAYVESIIFNLISNSIKFSNSTNDSFVKISICQEENFVVMSVQDNGIGIDLDRYQNRIFKLYERFHAQKNSRGLGLFMVKNQTEAIGGKITVESELGKGSEFKVYFLKAN